MKLVLAALALAAAGSGFLGRALIYSTPATSMAPTITIGDYLVMPAWFAAPPRRGDVVLFDAPDGAGDAIAYVKRVVGLPGDTVQYVDGALRIEGVEVTREPIEPKTVSAERPPAPAYRETIGTASYEIIEMDDAGFLDNTPKYTVPPGGYFVLGDNRDNSSDSRVAQVGMVRAEAIFGRVCVVYRFPLTFRNLCRAPAQPAANASSG